MECVEKEKTVGNILKEEERVHLLVGQICIGA